MEKKQKLLYLESLRGLAAIIVAIYHAGFLFPSIITDNAFIRHGYLMVDFFFVLSGYVIAYNYSDKIRNIPELILFQSRRFLRLYPLHLVTLLLFCCVELAKYGFELKTGIVANNPAFSSNDWGALINNIFLSHGFLESDMTFNEPSWSISVEFYTYIIFAVTSMLFQKKYMRMAMMVLVIIGGGIFLHQSNQFTSMSTITALARCIYGFFIGATTCMLIQNSSCKINAIFCPVISALTIGMIICAAFIPPYLFAPIFAVLIMCFYLCEKTTPLHNYLERPVLIFMGTISYGIYMWHSFVWWFISNGLKYGFHITSPLSDMAVYAIIGTGMMAVFSLSYLSYKFIEMPINDIRHKLKLKQY